MIPVCNCSHINLNFAPFRCKVAGEPGVRGGRPGAGERCSAGVHAVRLPAVPREVQPAAGAVAGAALPQHAGRGLPMLHAREWRGALQQPADRDAARQEGVCVRSVSRTLRRHVLFV